MGFGDEILATGHARRIFDANPVRVSITTCSGHPRWSVLWNGNPILATPDDVARGESVQALANASGCRPYIQYPFTTETGWRWTDWRAQDHVGELYLTEAELARGRALARRLGPFLYIEPSIPRDSTPNKNWGLARYQQVVRACRDLQFVRVLSIDPRPLLGANVHTIPQLQLREALGVLAAATAYVGAEGAMHHAAAAMRKPAAVVFGGCVSARNLGYPTHINIVDLGPDSPCGRYRPCTHCTAALASITVERVVEALHLAYAAGLAYASLGNSGSVGGRMKCTRCQQEVPTDQLPPQATGAPLVCASCQAGRPFRETTKLDDPSASGSGQELKERELRD